MVIPYSGRRILEAPGHLGMSCIVAFLPEDSLGVAVVTNAYFNERATFESMYAVGAIAMYAIDTALGLPKRDWSAAFMRTMTR